jgi:hypothetical protein
MKKKNLILTGLVAVLVASFFLIVGFSSYTSAQKDKSTCCNQKMPAQGVQRTGPGGKNCATKKNSSSAGEMIMENLSSQFLSISPFGY